MYVVCLLELPSRQVLKLSGCNVFCMEFVIPGSLIVPDPPAGDVVHILDLVACVLDLPGGLVVRNLDLPSGLIVRKLDLFGGLVVIDLPGGNVVRTLDLPGGNVVRLLDLPGGNVVCILVSGRNHPCEPKVAELDHSLLPREMFSTNLFEA